MTLTPFGGKCATGMRNTIISGRLSSVSKFLVGDATTMPRPRSATLVVICLASATVAFSQAEKPITVEWVPFVAKWVQTNETEGWRRDTVVISGIYVRDKQGSWYRRSTATVTHGDLPLAGALDTAYVYQRADNDRLPDGFKMIK